MPAVEQLVASVYGDMDLLDHSEFVVVESEGGAILGCGRLRPYPEFCEMASLAVDQSRRTGGVGRAIVTRLLERYTGDIYLICEDHVVSFFSRFGFQTIIVDMMPNGLRPKWQYFQSLVSSLNVMRLDRSIGAP